ncbi:unnamed protein product, partial [Adineta ricciae]
MEEFQYHHHHHHHQHHHGHDDGPENVPNRYATSFHGTEQSNVITAEHRYQQQQQQQQGVHSVPTKTYDGVQSTGSFHSISSLDSAAEMSKYFPDAQTPTLSPFRHQLEVGGQAQSATISNTRTTTTTNTVNAGPYIPVLGPS